MAGKPDGSKKKEELSTGTRMRRGTKERNDLNRSKVGVLVYLKNEKMREESSQAAWPLILLRVFFSSFSSGAANFLGGSRKFLIGITRVAIGRGLSLPYPMQLSG